MINKIFNVAWFSTHKTSALPLWVSFGRASLQVALGSFSVYAVGRMVATAAVKMLKVCKGLLIDSVIECSMTYVSVIECDWMFNEIEYWLLWHMFQDVLNIAGPIRPATLWDKPRFILSSCTEKQEAAVCRGNDRQCNVWLQFIPVWLVCRWKCKLFEISKHGGWKMWGNQRKSRVCEQVFSGGMAPKVQWGVMIYQDTSSVWNHTTVSILEHQGFQKIRVLLFEII